MNTPEKFDLVVIGSGPAGEKGAAAAAYFGKRVALIEKEDHYGGAAANTGTLPSMLVVGGGVIGCEYACIFGALGVEMTVVERGERLLGGIDREVSEAMREQMIAEDINVLLKDEVAGVSVPERDMVLVTLKSGKTLKVNAILVS